MKQWRIFIVEDDTNIRNAMELFFKKKDYLVETASNGLLAVEKLKNTSYDLVILDIMMPHVDGWDLCKIIREKSSVPIIIVTARNKEFDVLKGFELGADDYITKPFSLKELEARVRAVLARYHFSTQKRQPTHIIIGHIEVDPKSRVVRSNGYEIPLTPKEYELLHYLVSHPNQTLSRDQLLDHVWREQYINDYRTVDTHIKQLREKIDQNKEYIQTVWGLGYRFRVASNE